MIERGSRLKDVMKTPSGHDVIARLLYSFGLDENIVTKTPLGNITIGALQKLSLGKLNDTSIDALLRLLNSLDEKIVEEEETPVKESYRPKGEP